MSNTSNTIWKGLFEKFLSKALKLGCQPFNVNKGYKGNIKSMKAELPAALAGAPWFVSRKSFASFEIDQLVTLSLLETFVFLQLIPCQSTYCHNFTNGTLLLNSAFHEYTIDSAYIRTRIHRSGKESFAKIISRSTYCFTKRADILQNIVYTTFAHSNYFYQSGLNPLTLVQTI